MSCKGKSTRLFYWREHTAHMFMNICVCKVMYICSCECVCLLRKVCDKSAQRLDIEQMSLAADLGIRALVSYLPGVCLASCQCLPRPHRLSVALLCLTFCLLSIFAMFSTLLRVTEIKNYTIS